MYKTADKSVLWTQNFSKTHDHELSYADKFKVDDVLVTVGTEKALGVVVLNSETQELAEGDRSIKTKTLLDKNINALNDDVFREMVRAAADDPTPPAIPRLRLVAIE